MQVKENALYQEFIKHLEEFTSIRRRLHQIPELKYEEFKTTELLQKLMTSYGYEVKTGFGVTGFTAVLDSGKPGKVAAIRTEIDCIPADEINNIDYISQHPGCMHGCGHDGHMATILMIAKVLKDHKDKFKGKIKFIFQPAEEGGAGAKAMIEDGVLENPKVDVAFAYHNAFFKKGIIALKTGVLMAGAGYVHVTIKGKGGHGAKVEKAHNPILAGLSFLNEIAFLKMQKDPLDPYLLNVTSFQSGTAYNVIPDTADLKFTIRFFSNEKREEIIDDIHRILKGICSQQKVNYELKTSPIFYPPTINHEAEVNLVKNTAAEILQQEQIRMMEKPIMPSEDFSFFLEKVPGCMFAVGNGEENINHSTTYIFNDEIIPNAAYVLAKSAINWLNSH